MCSSNLLIQILLNGATRLPEKGTIRKKSSPPRQAANVGDLLWKYPQRKRKVRLKGSSHVCAITKIIWKVYSSKEMLF